LMRAENGLEIFGVWCLLVQVASRVPKRGLLADGLGEPYSVEDLSIMTDVGIEKIRLALPVLEKMGWILIHCSENAPTVINQPVPTIQDITEQDITEQNRTLNIILDKPVHPSEKFASKGALEIAWNKIPEGRRKGIGAFRNAWVQEITRTDIDAEMVGDKLKKYYESNEGRGKFWRKPATLISDEFWNESEEIWKGRDYKEEKFPQSSFDHDKIIAKYRKASKENEERVNDILMENVTKGMMESESIRKIAFKIWTKYPDLRDN
jgi:hypothetical protein